MSAWGSFWCFFLNAVSFLPLIFILGRIRKRQQEHQRPSAILGGLAEGLRYVREERVVLLLLASIFAAPITHAAVCDPNAFHGAYGFSLTGTTTIGGPARPVAVLGRLVLDGFGNVSGISSTAPWHDAQPIPLFMWIS